MKSIPPLMSIDPFQPADTPRVSLGCFEFVSFVDFGISNQLAKIDTGAYSGAIGCTLIEEVKRDGQKTLRFSPGRKSSKVYETRDYYQKYVKSSNGLREKRYLINTIINIQGNSYPIIISLSNRSDMKHGILIGRRFLREHNLLVDVSINQEYDTDSEAK